MRLLVSYINQSLHEICCTSNGLFIMAQKAWDEISKKCKCCILGNLANANENHPGLTQLHAHSFTSPICNSSDVILLIQSNDMNCRITVATEVVVSEAEMVEVETWPNQSFAVSVSLELENLFLKKPFTLNMTLKTHSDEKCICGVFLDHEGHV